MSGRGTFLLFLLATLIGAGVPIALLRPANLSVLQTILYGSERVSEFQNVSLGASMDAVRYAKGSASNFLVADNSGSEWQLWIPAAAIGEGQYAEKKDSDFNGWGWDEESKRVEVTFDPKAKTVSAIDCYDDKGIGSCSVDGIVTGDSEVEVVGVLGVAAERHLAAGGSTLRIDVKSLNLSVFLTKKKVYMISIRDLRKSPKL